MTFLIFTLGCKVNWCDSEDIAENLESSGFLRVFLPSEAQIAIVNSCAVTSESVRKTNQIIRKFKKENPGIKIVLTGCASEYVDTQLKNSILVIKNKQKDKIIDFLPKSGLRLENKNIRKKSVRTRCFLKIEDGCENFCSYCIIPYVRGKVRSLPPDKLIESCKKFAQKGFKEIVLSGINLCKYGANCNSDLTKAIEVAAHFFPRVRLGSVEPDWFDNEKITAIAKIKEFCPQFHLSLQSGSDKILNIMNRKYTRADYIEITEKIRKTLPNATFTTDIIVGFPGETEDDFMDSLSLIEKVGFIKVNVFPFSSRPETAAACLPQIRFETKKRRARAATEFSQKISLKVLKSFSGKIFNVLFEKRDNDGIFSGYTENYIKIMKKSKENLCGKIIEIKYEHN
jgi:threonylcarbamoyladenosine tRNA methylthiotransferase MtaB